jgi:hypothetical protein
MKKLVVLLLTLLALPFVRADFNIPPGITDISTGVKLIWDGLNLIVKGLSAMTAGVIAQLFHKTIPIEVGSALNVITTIFLAFLVWKFVTGPGKWIIIVFLILLASWFFLSLF